MAFVKSGISSVRHGQRLGIGQVKFSDGEVVSRVSELVEVVSGFFQVNVAPVIRTVFFQL